MELCRLNENTPVLRPSVRNCIRKFPKPFVPLIATLIEWRVLNDWNPLLQNQVGEKNLNGDDSGEDQKEEDRSQGQFFLNAGQ